MGKIKRQWFLLGLVLISMAVIFDRSDTLAEFGIILKNNHGPEVMIFLIFVISGLLIESDQIRAGIIDIKSTLLALGVIIIAAPVAAGLLCLFRLERGVAIGLFIVAAMPTTLSSGVVMTKEAGGNMAHALFVTILSNFISIFTIPVVLSMLVSLPGLENELVIDKTRIMIKLSLLVVLPLLVGMGLKARICNAGFLGKLKLQTVNQWLILGIVFISLAGAKQALLENGTAFFHIIGLVSVFHLMLLGVSFLLVKVFGVGKGRYESVIFMGSQKTLPLSVMIQTAYFNEFGIALLVCVIHHIVHLMIDGYLSAKMNNSLSS
ncbi:MAG: bile acid:sodium symporter [Deltaproteobacteria bacterium]|nr:bile acid:sodium symporter [Deltaproteobacteria bacterium]